MVGGLLFVADTLGACPDSLYQIDHPPAAANHGCSQLTAAVTSGGCPLTEGSHFTWGYLGSYAFHPWGGMTSD